MKAYVAHCPVCGAPAARLHRNVVDRFINLFRKVHRCRCTVGACGWEGLLERDVVAAGAGATAPLWRTRALWFVFGAAAALAAFGTVRFVARDRSAAAAALAQQARHEALAAAEGADYPGQELPESDARVVANASPLTLRHHCAWGVPGSNRYRGSVEQALTAARLPPEVVREISDLAQRGWVRTQVAIDRTGIRTLDRQRYFGKSIVAMGFGNTLCFDTRINFKAGHVEYANLYEATDGHGKKHTVMVPDVCHNVSVLGERAEDGDVGQVAGVAAFEVGEPSAWSTAALALGLLAWSRARRRPGTRRADAR